MSLIKVFYKTSYGHLRMNQSPHEFYNRQLKYLNTLKDDYINRGLFTKAEVWKMSILALQNAYKSFKEKDIE